MMRVKLMAKHRRSKTIKTADYFLLSQLSNKLGIAFLVLFSVFAFACQTPETENTNSPQKSKAEDIIPTQGKEQTKFEKELISMRMADFDYIFTLKRKDGKAFTSEDKAFVRENKHYAANRFSFIEDDKILFVGSNYEFSEENLKALQEYFEFKDFSKSKEQIAKELDQKQKEWEEKYGSNKNTETNSESSPDNSVNK